MGEILYVTQATMHCDIFQHDNSENIRDAGIPL